MKNVRSPRGGDFLTHTVHVIFSATWCTIINHYQLQRRSSDATQYCRLIIFSGCPFLIFFTILCVILRVCVCVCMFISLLPNRLN